MDTKGMQDKLEKESETSSYAIAIEDQIKNIFAMARRIFISQKAFKALYAILQSMSPDVFGLTWDGLFFSIYSDRLQKALSHLILETGEVEESLWRRDIEPFHHIYFLTEKGRRTIEKSFYENHETPFYSDVILWTLLEPRFSIFWSYLLEMFSYEGLSEEDKEKIPYIPQLEQEPNQRKRNLLRKQLEYFSEKISELKLTALKLGLSLPENNNLYILSPFSANPLNMKKFFNFYLKFGHNRYVTAKEDGRPNALSLKVHPAGVPAIYEYIRLEKTEIEAMQEQFKTTQAFNNLLDYYTMRLAMRIPLNEKCEYAHFYIREMAKERVEFLRKIFPEDIKKDIINKGKLFLDILNHCYDLAQWRYNHIMVRVTKVCRLSQRYPIQLVIRPLKLEGVLNQIPIKEQVATGLEFSEKFLKAYKKEFHYKLHSGHLHHIYHLIQPEEVWKGIHNDKEELLRRGGPIIGEY